MLEVKRAIKPKPAFLNDCHSKLNPSWVHSIAHPASCAEVQALVVRAQDTGMSISVAGARHAMGGQQFGLNSLHCDTSLLDRVISLDCEHGSVEVEAGITWPKLVQELHRLQRGAIRWTIAQKQTGADRLSIGGAVAANIHGRGLQMPPIISNIESLKIIGPDGNVLNCSRSQNKELFSLVIGGYGLFGIIYSVTLGLVRQKKLKRIVEIAGMEEVITRLDSRIDEGCIYGDFQYMTDDRSPDFLRKGVMACYEEVNPATKIPDTQLELDPEKWRTLLYLAHVDKGNAYDAYTRHYESTSGQLYLSDTMQMSTYLDDYHQWLDEVTASPVPGSEMITELYVPREELHDFMQACAADFRKHKVNVIYGTVRLIECDTESFLPWARDSWACVIFNLHVDHTPAGLMHAADAFRRLIDLSIARRGSYYLTYHRFATHEQIRAAHPRFEEFLKRKRELDPQQVFTSDWYAHYKTD